jgi:hypothetical protein
MTWANAFNFGPQEVKVWAGGASAWDWTGTLAKGEEAQFADPLSAGATLTVSVDTSGVVSLLTDAADFAGRDAIVAVGLPANATSARVVGALTGAASAFVQQVTAAGSQDGFPLSGGNASSPWTPNPADASHWPLAFMGLEANWSVG